MNGSRGSGSRRSLSLLTGRVVPPAGSLPVRSVTRSVWKGLFQEGGWLRVKRCPQCGRSFPAAGCPSTNVRPRCLPGPSGRARAGLAPPGRNYSNLTDPSIYLFAIPDSYDEDTQDVVLDLVNHSKVAHANSVYFFLDLEYVETRGAWVLLQILDGIRNGPPRVWMCPKQFLQLSGCCLCDFNAIDHRLASKASLELIPGNCLLVLQSSASCRQIDLVFELLE